MKKIFLNQKKSFSCLKKYYDYDDTEYRGIRGIENVFNGNLCDEIEIDEDSYKPAKTKSAFNDNYIEYENKGDKDKNLSPKEYLDMIRSYLSESLLQNYQKELEESKRGSKLARDSIDLLYCHLQKVSLKRGGSYIDSPEWLKNKKATVNPKNSDDNCFQYALTVVLNHQNIEKNPQRLSKIKFFIDQYNWKERNFPSHSKRLEKV